MWRELIELHPRGKRGSGKGWKRSPYDGDEMKEEEGEGAAGEGGF